MPTFRLRVAYDGGPYFGFQSQPGRPTVQAAIEEGIRRLTGEQVRIGYAGRTDTGVHAFGQVVSFATERIETPNVVLAGLNAHLPDSIVVRDAIIVEDDYDPRRWAISRQYRYEIENTAWPTPYLRRLVWHVRDPLDAKRMHDAGQALVGTVDLAGFTERSGRGLPSTVRRVDRLAVERAGDRIHVEIEANAFLPHVVRNIVGSLVWVGRGRRETDDIARILASRDRRTAGPTAPGHGLYLVRVRYPDDEPAPAGEGALP